MGYLGQGVVPVRVDQSGPQVGSLGCSVWGSLRALGSWTAGVEDGKHYLDSFTQWIILRPDQYINFQPKDLLYLLVIKNQLRSPT